MKIYRYCCDTDLYLYIEDTALDEVIDQFQERSLKKAWNRWKKVELVLDGKKNATMPDFFDLTYRVPVFTRSTLELFEGWLPSDVEILPLRCKAAEILALNFVNGSDGFLEHESDLERDEDGWITDYTRIVYEESKLQGIGFFRIPDSDDIYFTETVFDLMSEHDLKGLCVIECGETV